MNKREGSQARPTVPDLRYCNQTWHSILLNFYYFKKQNLDFRIYKIKICISMLALYLGNFQVMESIPGRRYNNTLYMRNC